MNAFENGFDLPYSTYLTSTKAHTSRLRFGTFKKADFKVSKCKERQKAPTPRGSPN
jgi:hypothetical protein